MKQWRRSSWRLARGVSAAWLSAVVAHASIASFTELKINFTDPADAATKASWPSNQINISTNGLGWDGEAATIQEGFIQTKPIAIGLAWRPTRGANVLVSLQPPPREIKLNSGQLYTPYFGSAFVRYSADAKHWSTWQALPRDNTNHAGVFRGQIQVPSRDHDRYSELREQYRKLDVPWVDDEEAFAQWLVKREPTFFAENIPFVGYVEILVEGSFHGGQRIRTMEVSLPWAVNGMHSVPKDKEAARKIMGLDVPWRFKAP
jgi:hypothetical protein